MPRLAIAMAILSACTTSQLVDREFIYFLAEEAVERADAEAVCEDLGAELASAADVPDYACNGVPCWISEATVGVGPAPVAYPLCAITLAP